MNNQAFYLGVVEDRLDPLMLGRVRVRIVGLHTHDKAELPTEDLPWAYKIQQTTSGAISGIGHAPVGVMEGTWVAIQFIDPDKQMPFVVGTLGGIPSNVIPPLESYEVVEKPIPVTTSSGAPLTTSDGTPVMSGATEEVSPSVNVRSASEFTTSESLIAHLKDSEGFSATPYQDSAGVWTIGYGSTFINGRAVTATTPAVTRDEALFHVRDRLTNEFEPAVKSAVRVPITQSMFDALVDFAYNLGGGTLRRSSIITALNTNEYETAADNFLLYNKARNATTGELEVLRGLTSRRTYERDLFLSEGFPTTAGIVKETPQSIAQEEIRQADPTTPSQTTTIKKGIFNGNAGFVDPAKKYPLQTHLGEPDTNRLARHQKIKETAVYFKELAEHKSVPKANGKGTWNQSPTPYNAEYPFNNVYQSESGHLFEFDDSVDRERIHLYHKKGTFFEIDHNGTQVTRVVGDNYTILERNGYVHVVGNVDVTVDGAKTLRVENTLDVEVHGKTVINLHSDADLNVAGTFNITAGGDINIKSGGTIAMDASPNVHINSGVASGLSTIGVKGGEAVELQPLTVRTRKEEAGAVYETPDDGTPAQIESYKEYRVENATATPEELAAEPTVEEEQAVAPNTVEEKLNECGIAEGTTNFDYNQKISKYFTLADLTSGGTRKLRDQAGLKASQIYCNLKALAENVLDPIKAAYPSMRINSGLRLENTNSQHNKGQAVDVSFPGLTRADLYDRAFELQQLVPHDQMLLEYLTPGGNGWIHISFNTKGNRRQVFTMNNHARVGSIGTFTKIT